MNTNTETTTYEIERKFLIEYPNLEFLQGVKNYDKTYIIQTYLKTDETEGGTRIRKRGKNNIFEYTKTYKKTITAIKRIEIEEVITKEDYEKLLELADDKLKSIEKYRHCFEYKGKMFELDTYTFWTDRATLEIELESENESFDFPPFIKCIKEVTNDLAYRNRSLAYSIYTEDIEDYKPIN